MAELEVILNQLALSLAEIAEGIEDINDSLRAANRLAARMVRVAEGGKYDDNGSSRH